VEVSEVPYPPTTAAPGSSYQIVLWPNTAFLVLLAVLALFLGMFFYLRMQTASKRALQGFIEATSVDIVFILGSILLILYLYARYPSGNFYAYWITQVILNGVWLTFAIPIVTVGNSVHHTTRGALEWRGSSIALALVLFPVILYILIHYPSVL
jgi:hypothetical protein